VGRRLALSSAVFVVMVSGLSGPAGAHGTSGHRSAPPPAPKRVPATDEHVKPVDTAGTDPVLDGAEVDPTAETRRTDGRFRDAAQEEGQRVLRWLSADRERMGLVTRAVAAGATVDRDQASLDDARRRVASELTVLARLRSTEALRRAALAAQQAELRRLAAAVLASAPVDEFAFMGNVRDVTAGDRRQAVRERSIAQQSRRVDRKRVPWVAARRARRAQDRKVAAARRARSEAEATLARAIHERDDFTNLVTAAQAKTQQRLADLERAKVHTHDTLVARRKARLTAMVSGTDMQLVALDAYWRASGTSPCFVPWWVIAGVGRVETRHGTAQGSTLLADGTTTVHIHGIPLDGRPGTVAVHDSDGGRLDDDSAWDRAVGPMQFLPGTWGRWATDQNADDVKDPHNMYDAAGAAAKYLCFGHGDLTDESAIRAALLSYNHSVPYGTGVLDHGKTYRDALGLPEARGVLE
jgi:hypothetical protein